MKKYLFIAAAAMVAMVACNKEGKDAPRVSHDLQVPVQFGTYVAQTKTVAITTDNITDFGVYGYYSDGADWSATLTPNFMFDQKVEGSHAGGFSYSPIKYWPNEASDKLSFFAYAPYKSSTNGIAEYSANNAAGAPTIRYTFPAEESNQVDILWATPVLNKVRDNDGDISKKIQFSFNHALSRLGLQVRYLADQVNVGGTIGEATAAATKIYLNSVTFTSTFASSGILNLQDGSWDSVVAGSSKSFTREFGAGEAGSLVSNENAAFISGDDYVMMMPQAGAQSIDVQVVYTVVTEDASLSGGKSIITNTISNSTSLSAQHGYTYDLVLVLGLESVKFDAPIVSEWGAGENTEVDLPINNA